MGHRSRQKPSGVLRLAGETRQLEPRFQQSYLRAELVRKGREHVARFSWENTARQVLEIYKEAAMRGSADAGFGVEWYLHQYHDPIGDKTKTVSAPQLMVQWTPFTQFVP